MRVICLIGLLIIWAVSAAAQANGQSWQIIPGKNAGPITKDTSEKDLIKIFGRINVKLSPIDVGEGETVPGTILFSNNPQKRAYILWSDTGTRLHPESISIRDKNTIWKTDKGITIGTSLRTIETLNGGAFALTGFAWDYEGTVVHSSGGKLTELGVGSGEDIVGRKLLLRLSPAGPARNLPEYNKVLGDRVFLSSDAAMKKINPAVYEMVVEFAEQANQSAVRAEEILLDALQELKSNSSYAGPGYDEEKLASAQRIFEKELLKYSRDPSTLNYDFKKLDQQMSIATAADRKFRVYSWDLEDGGTMHRFGRVNQYQAADGTVISTLERSPDEGTALGFVTDVFTIDAKTGKLYIVCSTIIASSKLQMQSADIYKIDGYNLNSGVKLFQTRSGLSSTIHFEYDNFSVIDRQDRPDKLITFDEKTVTLKIPVVIKDKEYPDGRVTERSINYRFDGAYFVKVN